MPQREAIPDDLDALRALVLAQQTSLDRSRQELVERDLEIEQLKAQIAKLKRMQFGRKSEKLARQIEQLETRLEAVSGNRGAVDGPSFREQHPRVDEFARIIGMLILLSIEHDDNRTNSVAGDGKCVNLSTSKCGYVDIPIASVIGRSHWPAQYGLRLSVRQFPNKKCENERRAGQVRSSRDWRSGHA